MDRYPIRTSSSSRRPRPQRGLLRAWLVLAGASILAGNVFAQQNAPNQQPLPGRPVIRPQVTIPQAGPPHSAPPRAPGQVPAPPGVTAASHQPDPSQPAAAAPFQLTPQEQLQLDNVLNEWEQHSEKVEVFRCKIRRFEHDPIFGKDRESEGEMKYRAPDRGLYRVWDKATGDWIEDWRCDGKAIYEFNFEKKQLIERTLPRELQGKAIANGPLPFIFSAKAVTLKQRYFMRLKAPPENIEKITKSKMICIEAYPRFQSDAANFRRAELLLIADKMIPYGLRLDLPNGKSKTDHVFFDVRTNNPLDVVLSEFDAPRTPVLQGWKRIIDPEGPPQDLNEAQATAVTPPAAAPQQATRPASADPR